MSRRAARGVAGDDRGVVAVTIALTFPVLVGFMGLGAEAGYVYFEQRRLQASADLAAYAGAVVARAGGDLTRITAAAEAEAEGMAFNPARGAIAVRSPPTAGPNMNARSVEVELTQSLPRLVSGLFIAEDYVVGVRAVASYDQPGPACMIALHETESQAMWFTGSANATFDGCELMSNSLAADAVSVQGNVTVTTTCVGTAGGVDVRANLVLTGCPEPRLHMPRARDPYAGLAQPASGPNRSVPNGTGAMTLSPGKYGTMALKGDVTLEPGVYVVDKLQINAGAKVTGSGVTFYVTGDVSMNGGATIDLAAPTSGTYRGVLFYADPTDSSIDATFNGSASSSLRGAIYMPAQEVKMNGNFSGSGGCTRIVALKVSVRGNPSFGNDCEGAGLETITAPGAVRLVE